MPDVHNGITFYCNSNTYSFAVDQTNGTMTWPATTATTTNYFIGIPIDDIYNGTVTITVNWINGSTYTPAIKYCVRDGDTSVTNPSSLTTKYGTYKGTVTEFTVSTLSNENKKAVVYLAIGPTSCTQITSITITTPSSYTVTYDENGATSGTAPTDSDSPYAENSTVTVLDNTGSLTKTGYVFDGWNTEDDGTGTDYAAGATFTITGNTTLYAKWAQRPVITTQPTAKSICVKDAETTLTADATASAGVCSYQWYSCDDAEKTNPATVSTGSGYATASFSPSTATAGNYYYFCRVTDSNGSVDTDVALVRVSANTAKSTWDLSSITAADIQLNTDFWEVKYNDENIYYDLNVYSANERMMIENNFETDMLNGIRFYRTSALSAKNVTLFIGRGINVQGTTSVHVEIPATSGHYYRITHARGGSSATYGYSVSSGATFVSGNLTYAFTDNNQRPSFIVKATASTINLAHTNSNYPTLSKVEEVEAFVGAWSTASNYVYQNDDSPSLPSFAVTASNGTTITKDTHYSVTYSLKDGSTAGIVTVNSSTGITGISTSTAGTATVVATITDLNTSDGFVVDTESYEYTVTVAVPTEPTISIEASPYTTVSKNSTATLTADIDGDPEPTIQWYCNTSASNSGGTPIEGETDITYTPSTSSCGTYYYYAVATNRAGETASNVITLSVKEYDAYFSTNAKAYYSVSVSTNETPYTEIASTYATTDGGAIYAHNGYSSAQGMVVTTYSNSFCMTQSGTYFKITLNNAIQEGDIITFKLSATGTGRTIYISTDEDTNATVGNLTHYLTHDIAVNGTETVSHTVTADETWLINATTLYIYRSGSTYLYFDELTISHGRFPSDFAAISGKSALCLSSSTYTLTDDVDFTTSSDGTITYESDNEDVATVDENGVITYAGLGTATITVSQAVTDDYKAGSVDFTVYGTGAFTKGTTTLDFSNATATKTMLTGTWTGDAPYFGNDGTDNYMVFSPYSAYKSAASQTWVNDASGSDQADNANTWTYSDNIFRGIKVYKNNYRGTANKTVWYGAMNAQTSPIDRRTATRYTYRVKGISKAEAVVRGGQTMILAAHPVSESTASNVTHLFSKASTSGFNKLSVDLDENTEYVVALSTTATENERFFEMAFFYDAETDLDIEETISTVKGTTTFVSRSGMDFTNVSGVKAYVATSNDNSSVTLTRVRGKIPGGTPLILKVDAINTNYNIPVGCQADAPAVNNLTAADGVTDLGGDDVYDYVMYEGQFCHIGTAAPVAIGKCYLHFDTDPTADAARALDIRFVDDEEIVTFIDNENLRKEQKQYSVYNLNGQKMSDKTTNNLTKGLYIVNGKKVIIK